MTAVGVAAPSELVFDAARMIAVLERQRRLHARMAEVLAKASDEIRLLVEDS